MKYTTHREHYTQSARCKVALHSNIHSALINARFINFYFGRHGVAVIVVVVVVAASLIAPSVNTVYFHIFFVFASLRRRRTDSMECVWRIKRIAECWRL